MNIMSIEELVIYSINKRIMRNLKYLLLILFFVGFCGVGYAQHCDGITFNKDGTITNNRVSTIQIKIQKNLDDNVDGAFLGSGGTSNPYSETVFIYDDKGIIRLCTHYYQKNKIDNPPPISVKSPPVSEKKEETPKPKINNIKVIEDTVTDNNITVKYSIDNFKNNYLRLPNDSTCKLKEQEGEIQFSKVLDEGQNFLTFELFDSSGNKIDSLSVKIIYKPLKLQTQVELTPTERFLKAFEENIIFIAAGIFALLLIIILLLVNKSKKKKKIIKKTTKTNSGITINPKSGTGSSGLASKGLQAKIGLQHLRANGFKDFYTINLDEIFKDTVVKNVYLSRNCIIDIYDFFQEFLKSSDSVCETGCFLFGCWEYENDREGTYNITIEQILKPGKDASFKEDSFNFGSIDIDKEIIIKKLREKTGNEWVQTAWMHSHPGLNIFLSNADLKVQEALGVRNHKSRLIAIVLDNLTENLDMVFFSAKKDGTMNNEFDVQKKHSLDFLYNWAIKCAVTKETESNYFQINSINPDNSPSSIYLPDNVIIDINKALMVNKTGEVSGFKGKINAQYAVISDFIPAISRIDPNELMGIMLCGNNLAINYLMVKYRTFNLIAFFEIERNEITFYFKKSNRFELFANPVSFAELIKWNRRRRF